MMARIRPSGIGPANSSPPPGIRDNEAINVVQDIYQAGFDNLKKCLPYNPLCH